MTEVIIRLFFQLCDRFHIVLQKLMGTKIHIIHFDFACQIFLQTIIGYFDLICIVIYIIQRIEI